MNYEFSLDKKSVISLIAGSVVIGVLLFFSGLIVGRQWFTSEATAASPSNAEEQRAELPKEPVLSEEAPPRNVTAPKNAGATVAPPAEAKVTVPQTALQMPAGAPAASVPAAPAAAAPQPASDGRVVIVSEAEADGAKEAAGDPEYVTVQVGVFLDEKDASRLLKQIESKGYSPTFFSGRDAEARQWYAVRVGIYSDREQATRAAANFTKQEKMKAVVRPLESL